MENVVMSLNYNEIYRVSGKKVPPLIEFLV